MHSNTGHLKDIASSSLGMISDLVDLTDLPDAFPSFYFIGSSEEREQLIKEIDLAYQESLKADELKTVTSKEENHNTINFDPDLDVIEKSNINNEEATRIRNARCKRVFPELSASEEKFMVSVRHPTLGKLQRLFTQQATVSALYDWVGSLNDYPIYFKLVHLSKELKPTERLASYRNSVLNVSECIEPVRFEEEEEATCAGYKYNDCFSFGDEEFERVLIADNDDEAPSQSSHNSKCNCNFKKLLSVAKNDLPLFSDGGCFICHRRPESFWVLLFKQKFDFRRHTRVIWAGEPSDDAGGPHREFLLFAMIHIPALHKLFFGNENRLLFMPAMESVVEKHYRIIDQLSALAILHLRRGQHCFDPSVINYMFYSQVDNHPQLVDHGDLMDNISQIESEDNSPLYECNIHPIQDKSKNISLYKQHFLIISMSARIEQFKQGLLSISSQFPKSGCCLEKYFVKDQKCLTYHDVRSQIVFRKTAEEGSNTAFCQENAIIEFEQYLMSLEHGQNGVLLKDFLRFVTATDRIPLLGFDKKIKVFLNDENLLPRSSTCGLMLYLPQNVTKNMFETALKEGLSFGII